ncbi:helix-turn-helix domain-containing protein [Methylobacterium sp. E-016]|uniref:helix-turn-helix transcriptional regulator n=1 Tax=Methylobacterium sp. E-016 TaxID=2836556 RepID=UPI001FB8893B|nr:helix-turn-helix transcriptional regulator [Methylobacterium sp. E-016]MCJ2074431.1 helix-turn-helix domain-containing protein [Methylobacterium sp. E-016]
MYPNGSQIRAARALLDMTRDELAAIAGVSPRTIDNLESGHRKPIQATQNAVMGALMGAGVEFDPGDPDTGRGPGVYLRMR